MLNGDILMMISVAMAVIGYGELERAGGGRGLV